MSRHWLLPLLGCVALLAGCGVSREPEDDSPDPASTTTTVAVDNRGFLDMTVYVLDGSRRVRLGIANGSAVTTLTIPPSVVRGSGRLQFLSDPIGGSQTPVSQEIIVQPGDRVRLLIPGS